MEDSNPFRWVLAELKRVRISICESIVFCRGGTLHDTVEFFRKRCVGEDCLLHSDKEGLKRIGPFYHGAAPLEYNTWYLWEQLFLCNFNCFTLHITHNNPIASLSNLI